MIDLDNLVDPDNQQLVGDLDQSQEVQMMKDLNSLLPQMHHF